MKSNQVSIEDARQRGHDETSRRPYHAPRCPYQEADQEALKEAWYEGAEEAGWMRIYTNGVLNGSL